MHPATLLILALGLPSVALAAEPDPCAKLTVQQEMTLCISKAVSEADLTLNRVYRQLNDKLDGNGKRNLIAAERAWITFRDRECELRAGYDTRTPENNGTIAPFLVGECKLDLTRQRIADLRAQMKCPGGDLSCTP